MPFSNNGVRPLAEYTLFPGCLISFRFPQFESSTTAVLKKLGIEITPLENLTCCPEPVAIRPLNRIAWYTIAARNISLAERKGRDLLTICNGCNGTLSRVNEDLKTDNELRKKVNENLKAIGMKFEGNITVKSILRLFCEDVGLDRIREKVEKPLRDIKVAVHYGCHILDEIKDYDDARNPKSLNSLVGILGAKVCSYPSQMLCCGSHISGYVDESLSHRLIMEKINDLIEVNADCLAVICPYCFLQYDLGQMILSKKLQRKNQIPILYYPQLLGLAMGFSAHDMGLELHKINADKLVQKLNFHR